MKCVVISGVSGGMGLKTAEKFIEEGYEVFGLDVQAAIELDHLHFIRTDITDQDAVQNAFKEVSGYTEKIDSLIHMAGVYDLNSLVEMREEEFIRIFNVNLFSEYRINKTFLPLLKKGSRIVITSSELAPLDPLPFTGIYGITKTAVEKYAYSLRMELQLLDIDVIVLRPGAIDTGLLDVSTQRLDDFCSNTSLYSCNAERFKRIVDSVESKKVPPERIADLAYKAVIAKRPKLVYTINRNPLLLLLNALPGRLQNWIIKKILK